MALGTQNGPARSGCGQPSPPTVCHRLARWLDIQHYPRSHREVPPSYFLSRNCGPEEMRPWLYTYSWFKAPRGLKYQVRVRSDGGMVRGVPTHRGGLETQPDPSSAPSWHRLNAEGPTWVSGATR